MAVVVVEGAVRWVRRRPPGVAASRVAQLTLLFILLTAAGGLALLLTGHRPHEWLHLVYAVLVFGAVPVGDSLAARASTSTKAAARVAAGVIGLVLTIRLIGTG